MKTGVSPWLVVAIPLIAITLVGSSRSYAGKLNREPVRIGYLGQGAPADAQGMMGIFKGQLAKLGYQEGKDVVLEPLWANGDVAQLPSLAARLVEGKVDIIVTSGTPGARAAKNATTTIPVIATGMAIQFVWVSLLACLAQAAT
jgi:putative ABC transport system substrate-binding protein